jgi:phosphatidylserine decarboxylase
MLIFFLSSDWTEWFRYSLLILSSALCVLFLIFFRDPERVPPTEERIILAPADGKIIKVEEETDEQYPGGRGILISIFMSVWNVHVNRAPITGRVTSKAYKKGKFVPAFKDEASRQNEQCGLVIENDGKSILIRQISGILARRIITYPGEGDDVRMGERIGMILFGSRLDIFMPLDCKIRVCCDEKTQAGKTILGVL